MEVFAIIISFLALAFSAFSWHKSHQVGKRQLEIEENREDDRKSGKLRVFYINDGGVGKYYFQNEGDIGLSISDILWNKKPIPEVNDIEALPFPILLPPTNTCVPIRVDIDLSTPKEYLPPLNMTINWKTTEGKLETMEVTVTDL